MGYLDGFEVCTKDEVSARWYVTKHHTADILDEFIESGNEVMVKDYETVENARKVYNAFRHYAKGKELPVDIALRKSRVFLVRR